MVRNTLTKKSIYSNICFAFIFLSYFLYILSLASCNNVSSFSLPSFSLIDIDGNNISDTKFRSGNSIIFLNDLSEEVYSDILKTIEKFEKLEKISFNKMLVTSRLPAPSDWHVVNPDNFSSVSKKFNEITFIVLQNSRPVLTVDARNINKPMLLWSLFSTIKPITNHFDRLADYLPEDYLDVGKLSILYLNNYEVDVESYYLVVINNIFQKCDNIDIFTFIENTLLKRNAGIVFLLAGKFDDSDIFHIKRNFNVNSQIFLIDESLSQSLDLLNFYNLSIKYNIILTYDSERTFHSSRYLLEHCQEVY